MPGKLIGGEDYLLQVAVPNAYFQSRWRTRSCVTMASMSASGIFSVR
jgi:hypothetical protein